MLTRVEDPCVHSDPVKVPAGRTTPDYFNYFTRDAVLMILKGDRTDSELENSNILSNNTGKCPRRNKSN